MQLRRWLKRARMLAVSGAFALLALAPITARADGSDRPPGPHERIVKIGPQAVVIENDRGEVRMYDDPSQDVHACEFSPGEVSVKRGQYMASTFYVCIRNFAYAQDSLRSSPGSRIS